MVIKVDTTHPEYNKHLASWVKCRTIVAGSEEVKSAGSLFLPKLTDQSVDSYKGYVQRALFFEGTTRTVAGLLGMLFSKEPTMTPDKHDFFTSIIPGVPYIKSFFKEIGREILTVGRVGILVDAPNMENAVNDPYFVTYKAESIINWREEMVDGEKKLTHVVLKEEEESFNGFERSVVDKYRVLSLVEGVYQQTLYTKAEGSAKGTGATFVIDSGYPMSPQNKGAPITEIPFFFLSPNGSKVSIDRPPLLGLVNVNLAHYMNSADLEHGRHYTGLPTAWVAGFSGAGDTQGALRIGSETAWVSSNPDAKAGYLEFTGQGLQTLENGLKEKQDLMIVLGARLLEAPKKASESDANQKNRKQGENSVLANIADSLSETLTAALKFAAEWSGVSETFSVEIHKDFTMLAADDRLVLALMQSTQARLMSPESFFYNLKRMGAIKEGVTFEEEMDRINSKADWLPFDGITEPDEPDEPNKPMDE